MTPERRSLFREEAVRHHANRLEGSISLATPLGWQVVCLLLVALLVATAAFLVSTSYARSQVAVGVITLDKGVAAIVPSRSGVIEQVMVREGQAVARGAVLARIRSEEALLGGGALTDLTRSALSEQQDSLDARDRYTREAAVAERGRLLAQRDGLSAELVSLDGQIADQRRLVELASTEFEDLSRVADRGFISRRDLQLREATFVTRRQQLAQLEQARATRRAAVLEATRTIAESEATERAEIETSRSTRAALQGERARVDLSEGYLVRAPVDGVTAGVTARAGGPADPQTALMTVVPSGAVTMAELRVPTSAAGFLAPGQSVRLAVDAFPYQRFGTLPGRILNISAATTTTEGADSAPVYLVNVALSRPWIYAYGRREPLAPGMVLRARIVGEKRSLMEWLLDPLLAVRRR